MGIEVSSSTFIKLGSYGLTYAYTQSLIALFLMWVFFFAFDNYLHPMALCFYYARQGIPIRTLNPFSFTTTSAAQEKLDIPAKYPKGFVRMIANKCVLHIIDPELLREILIKRDSVWPKHPIFGGQLKLLLGNGLILANGDLWKKQRRIANKAFQHDKLVKMIPTIEQRCNLKIQSWEKRFDEIEGDEMRLKFDEEMASLTLDIIGTCAFGEGYENFVDEKYGTTVTELVVDLQEGVIKCAFHTKNIIGIFLPWLKLANYDQKAIHLKDMAATMHRIATKIIRNRVNLLKKDPSKLHEIHDLLNLFIEATLEGSNDFDKLLDDTQIADESITFILAGHDTTSNTLSWFFYVLNFRPDIKEKVIEEVRRVFADEIAAGGDELNITPVKLDKLAYTFAVIRETLRVYPAVPSVINRQAAHDTVIGDIRVKKGTQVRPVQYYTHHHPAFWPTPEKFDPERHVGREQTNDDIRWMPFSAGRRSCIGQFFALMEAKIIIVKLVARYDFRLDETVPIVEAPQLGLKFLNGLYLHAKRSETVTPTAA